MSIILISSKYATIIFAFLGLLCGVLLQHSYTMTFAFLGGLIGAAVSIVTSAASMIVNRINRMNVISLVLNLILFIVIARGIQMM
jgi:hypothetical protein